MTMPSARQFLTLCDALEIEDIRGEFTEGQAGVFAGLNHEGRQRALEYVRLLRESGRFAVGPRLREVTPPRMLPLYSLAVSAGTGQFLDSSDYTLLEVDETVPLSATFAVRVSGDSMEPRFIDRQIIYVKPQQTLERGEIGVFLLSGDAYCKQLGGSPEKPQLLSLNPAYAPIPVDPFAAFRVLGKVVG